MILINTKFSRWTVIGNRERLDKNGHRRYRYLCLCDCGVQKYVFRSDLTQGKSKSCGCLRKDNLHQTIIHGQARKNSHSRTYNIWAKAKREGT